MTAVIKDKGVVPETANGSEADTDARSGEVSARQERVIISEIQLILAEKRTSLAAMRTGIAVFVLPLSVLSVLIGTSEYYNVDRVMPLLLPLLLICAALVFFGVYMVMRSMTRIHHQDRMILQLKRKHSRLAPFID
jgi:uncharacterized membrane protein YkgB